MKGMTPEQSDYFDKIWKRYHDGETKDLPSQVYLDFGYLMGLIMSLIEENNLKDDLIGAGLARLQAAEAAVIAERCPHCLDQGFWINQNEHTGDPEQVQCEWCATNPNSRFQKEIVWRKAAGK